MAQVQPPDAAHMLAVVIGGGIGSLLRFVAGHYLPAYLGSTFPWATLLVNVTGSLWLGFIGTMAIAKPGAIDVTTRLLLTTGFAGGFTTFSTLTFESLSLYERGDINLAMLNIASNLIVGLICVFVGAILARIF